MLPFGQHDSETCSSETRDQLMMQKELDASWCLRYPILLLRKWCPKGMRCIK
jgi:hypothetical protein